MNENVSVPSNYIKSRVPKLFWFNQSNGSKFENLPLDNEYNTNKNGSTHVHNTETYGRIKVCNAPA